MPVPIERAKHRRTLLRDEAYVSIRDAIINGTLEPGERLRDPDLEKWLGISRTPIREAVARLEAAGLVQTIPGRSTVVSSIERKAVMNAQGVAAAMHALAVRTAVPLMAERDINLMVHANKRFAKAVRGNDPESAIRSDDDFHRVAVDASRNEVIAQVLEQVSPVLRRLEYMRFSSLSGRDSIVQHEDIIDACRRGDIEGAATATERNWQALTRLVEATEI